MQRNHRVQGLHLMVGNRTLDACALEKKILNRLCVCVCRRIAMVHQNVQQTNVWSYFLNLLNIRGVLCTIKQFQVFLSLTATVATYHCKTGNLNISLAFESDW